MNTDTPVEVAYGSACTERQGWDVISVVFSQGRAILNSFVIARDGFGTILRRTDGLLDRWEVVEDPDDLRKFRRCFDGRDKAAAGKGADLSFHS
jgi:hypothetical protein